jgi:hypothetical protein
MIGDTFDVALPLIVIVVLGGSLVFLMLQQATMRREAALRHVAEPSLPPAPPWRSPARERPWWGSPWLWAVVCLTFAVLGFVVWPGLFGGTFLLLPFVWIRRSRREADMDPRTNGHTERDPETFTGD